jgi:hypothetical protein
VSNLECKSGGKSDQYLALHRLVLIISRNRSLYIFSPHVQHSSQRLSMHLLRTYAIAMLALLSVCGASPVATFAPATRTEMAKRTKCMDGVSYLSRSPTLLGDLSNTKLTLFLSYPKGNLPR